MKLIKPDFDSGSLETMNKLFLELSLVCDGAKTWRDIQHEQEIARLNEQLAKFRAKVNAQSQEAGRIEHQRHALEKALRAALAVWCPRDPGGDGADGETYRQAHEALQVQP